MRSNRSLGVQFVILKLVGYQSDVMDQRQAGYCIFYVCVFSSTVPRLVGALYSDLSNR